MSGLFLGLDVGTSGVRAVVVTERGTVIARGAHPLPPTAEPLPGHREQNPEDWWVACKAVFAEVVTQLRQAGETPAAIRGLAVDSTSGTVVPVGSAGEVLRPALLYNDARAVEEAEELNATLAELCGRLGYRFNASFGLPKMLWLARHEPAIVARCAKFLHAADFIAGRLTGAFDTTDSSNVLKSGYDVQHNSWPEALNHVSGFPMDRLPEVVRSGTVIGHVCETAAAATGLAIGTAVVAGATDGTAGALAAGVARPGDAATTLGSTLVIKAVSQQCVTDPLGRVYSHVHPAGGWLPGGAGNTGCAVVDARFDRNALVALDAAAARCLPTDVLLYPLLGRGERFPVVNPALCERMRGSPRDEAERFAAHLQGIAFVERWCYDVLAELGCPVGPVILSTGGGSRSPIWNRVRAAVLGRELRTTESAECALGAAMLAAAPLAFGGDTAQAIATMARLAGQCIPQPAQIRAYQERYLAFREMMDAASA